MYWQTGGNIYISAHDKDALPTPSPVPPLNTLSYPAIFREMVDGGQRAH